MPQFYNDNEDSSIFNYDTGTAPTGQYEYVGKAPKGTSNAEAKWVIRKYSYSGVTVTGSRLAVGIWDNRATLTYA